MFAEDDYLQLSGLQHFVYCRRRWGLITIYGLWQDNDYTISGDLMHERAHAVQVVRKKKGVVECHGLSVYSSELGVSGQCDVVEFHLCEDGVPVFLFGEGLYRPVIVEYKHGSGCLADEYQLCAQAMCLEDMLGCSIERGYLFVGARKHRKEVAFVDDLRFSVRKSLSEMHELYARKHVPVVRTGSKCKNCSMKDLCVTKHKSVSDYMRGLVGDVCAIVEE